MSTAGRRLWRAVLDDFELDAAGMELLGLACRALDRAALAQAALEEDGLFQLDRYGSKRVHPGVAIVRDASTQAARLLRELGLDAGELVADVRPPRITGRGR
jgi:phage terminase small subunit